MIDDDELETILRRYRVGDPAAGFGDRIGDAGRDAAAPPHRAWGPALAAAILVVWTAVHAIPAERQPDPARDAQVAAIAEVLGGGEDALQYAELVVPHAQQDPLMPFEPPGEPPW